MGGKSGLSGKDKLILLGIVALMVTAVLLYRQKSVQPQGTTQSSSTGVVSLMPADSADELAHFEAMFKAHPDHAPIALQLANIHSDRQQHKEAIEYYYIYMKLDSSSKVWESYLDIAREYFQIGMRDSSRIILHRLGSLYPDHPGVLYNNGALAANDGLIEEARERWKRLIEIAPDSPEAATARQGLIKLGSND